MQHQSIIPWMGGKRRLATQVLSKFGQHTCYVEPFAGAGAIFFAKPPSDVEVLNDINRDLVNLYRVVQNHLEEFVRQFKWALSSRQVYEWEQAKAPDTLTDIQRAARFFYLQKQSFGARVDGQSYGTATTTGPRLNLLRLEEDLSQAHVRLHGAYIENMPWQQIIERYDRPHTMHYLDPPYWQTEGYGPEFPWSEYEHMAQLADEVQGPLLISLNDHPDIRRLFEGRYHIETATLRHTVGGGAGTETTELLIWNDRCEQLRPAYGSLDMFAADGVQ